MKAKLLILLTLAGATALISISYTK
jgi:hypothetical protein